MLSRNHFQSLGSLRVGYLVLFLLLLGIVALYANRDLRDQLTDLIYRQDRQILATLKDDLEGLGNVTSVLKVRERGRIYLEFYSYERKGPENGEDQMVLELKQKLPLANSLDGYVTFMGEATNLAIGNLDADPQLELLVPTYNSDFVASLEVVKFNQITNKFEIVPAFDWPDGVSQGIEREER